MIRKFVVRALYSYWSFYVVLALIILWSALLPGLIAHSDILFAPNIVLPHASSPTYPFYALLQLMHSFLPADVVQKLLLLAILVVSGAGMHRLVAETPKQPRKRQSKRTQIDVVRIYGKTRLHTAHSTHKALPAYFAGMLYVMNPFSYERWMSGEFLFLVGYAILPWLVSSLFSFVNRPSWKRAFRLCLLYTSAAICSLHIALIALFAGIIAGYFFTLSAPQKSNYLGELLQSGAFMVLLFAVINSFWLSPLLRSTPPSHTLTLQKLETYTTAAHPQAGLLANVIGLHGFWLERQGAFMGANNQFLVSLPALLVLLALVAVGAVHACKHDKPKAYTLLTLGALGFSIACGIHAPWGAVNQWPILHLPFFYLFSEPEKFSVLLVLLYAYFGAYGVHVVSKKVKDMKDSVFNYAPYVLLVLPLALTPAMPLGFAGQLKTASAQNSPRYMTLVQSHQQGMIVV